ncbi:hypothetical protein [Sinorhizobium meliloti]|nr:hypothetical protein [Sinorhizobium meliloti]
MTLLSMAVAFQTECAVPYSDGMTLSTKSSTGRHSALSETG